MKIQRPAQSCKSGFPFWDVLGHCLSGPESFEGLRPGLSVRSEGPSQYCTSQLKDGLSVRAVPHGQIDCSLAASRSTCKTIFAPLPQPKPAQMLEKTSSAFALNLMSGKAELVATLISIQLLCHKHFQGTKPRRGSLFQMQTAAREEVLFWSTMPHIFQ